MPLISICSLNLAVYLNIRKRSRGLIRSKNCDKKHPEFKLKLVVDNGKIKTPLLIDDILKVNTDENIRNEEREYDFKADQNEIVKHETNVFKQTDNNSKSSNLSTKPGKPNTKQKSNTQMTSRAFLSKDKKAARSLFILVFVFVICWVS